MLHKKLVHPQSIVIIGGSDHLDHLGGSVLKNLIDQKFQGDLFVVNPKRDEVQGQKSYRKVEAIPDVDLAIIAIPAKEILPVIKVLSQEKNTKGFMIYSAGFGELNAEGANMEQDICNMINKAGGSLLGPNNIGMINQYYAGVFTRPIPKLDPKGVDFISGSGATAVFTMEVAHQLGLSFSGLYTVGNSVQIGIEEILEYLDLSYVTGESSPVKILYIEGIKKPQKFLKHCRSLKQKGCEIAALKSGTTEKGNKAATSHTGAIASSDLFVQALFNKAGIIRCQSRYELINTAGILQLQPGKLKNIAIITHAGGPGVILTDSLYKNGLQVPDFSKRQQDALSAFLYPGASVKNPVDILATGTAEQLGNVIQYCDDHIDEVDAMAVIFGSPGLGSVSAAYNMISDKISTCKKPIFAILPSVVTVKKDIKAFIAKGKLAFYDESMFGTCMANIINNQAPYEGTDTLGLNNQLQIRALINNSGSGYLDPEKTFELLNLVGIETVKQHVIHNNAALIAISKNLDYPVVQKVIGPLHKTDKKGVLLNVNNSDDLINNYKTLMRIKGAKGIIIQTMIKGKEVFIGAKKEINFAPLILCGAGGIYVEILKDISYALVPVSLEEGCSMIKGLKIFPILQGIRGEASVDIHALSEAIHALSQLLTLVPEIAEMDINPLMVNAKGLWAVDARIRIEK